MRNLITVADFTGVVPVSVNIAPALVDPHIADAQLLDLWPLLPEALRTDLQADPQPEKAATLFADYLKRLLVLESARRLLLWHGLHITPNGPETILTDLNRAAISDQQRSQLRADLAAKAAACRPLAEVAIRAAYPVVASGCGRGARRPTRGGFQSSAV